MYFIILIQLKSQRLILFKYIRYFLLILSFLFSLQILGQMPDNTLVFRNISIDDGLAHVTVNTILQDSLTGLIWMGTTDGLNRYNGYEFSTYKRKSTDSLGLQSNDIRSLIFDDQHQLWLATNKGLAKYDPVMDRVIAVSSNGLPTSNKVMEIANFENDQLLIGTDSGLYVFHKNNGLFHLFDDTAGLKIIGLLVDSAQNIWISTTIGGIYAKKQGEKKWRHIYEANNDGADFHALHQLPNGNIIAGGQSDSLLEISTAGESYTINPVSWYSGDAHKVQAIYRGPNDDLWLGTSGDGLFRYSIQNKHLAHFQFDAKNPNGLSSTNVRCITNDREGNVWLGTWGGGVNILNLDQERFNTTRVRPNSSSSLSSNFIHAFAESATGGIWVGTRKGLNFTPDSCKTFRIPAFSHLITDQYIKCILEDHAGRLWIGTENGLNLVKNGQVTQFYHNEDTNSLSYNDITFVYQDKSNQIWVGTWNGLNRFNEENQSFDRFIYSDDKLADYSKILSLAVWNGKFWLGTYNGGLLAFDPITKSYERFTNENRESGLSNDRIWSLYANDDHLWVGTFGGGLQRVSLENDALTFSTYTSADGLANESIIAILEDDQENLWISGNTGISRFDIDKGTFTNFDVNDGLQSNHYNVAALKTTTGRMFFGGSNGLNHFQPKMVRKNAIPPTTIIDQMELFHKPLTPRKDGVLETSPLLAQKLILEHNQNVLSFGFSNSSYKNQAKNLFAYRLTGFDQDWVYADYKRRFVTYTSLPAGNYSFEVKSTNNAGVWSAPKTLSLTVLAPWWEQWWFRVSLSLLVVGSIIGFYHVRVRLLNQQKKRLEAEVKARTAELNSQKNAAVADKQMIEKQAQALQQLDVAKNHFFANVSHELRTPITLMTAPVDQILTENHLPQSILQKLQTIAKNGERLQVMVEEILDLARLEAGKMVLNLNPFDLKATLEELLDRYKDQTQATNIELALHYQISPEQSQILIDQNKVVKVVDNLMSNAIKFTPQSGKIEIIATHNGHTYTVLVSDTGTGIPKADLPHIFDRFYQSAQPASKLQGGTGIGLALARELALLMNGDIVVTSELGVGTTFTFSFDADLAAGELADTSSFVDNSDIDPIQSRLESVLRDYNLYFNKERPTIVIAEDHPEMRQFISDILRPWFNVIAFMDGQQALNFLLQNEADLIISDIMMPNMDGLELLENLKNDPQLSQYSVVMLTARSGEEDKLAALTIGVDDYIVKPFKTSVLLARIKNILQNRLNRSNKPVAHRELTADQQLIAQLRQIIISDTAHVMSVNSLAAAVAMSERQLQRKIKEITGLKPLQLIKEIKLVMAHSLLERKQVTTVADAAYKAGYKEPQLFSKHYMERFGARPSSHLNL